MLKLRPDALTWLEIEGEIVALDQRSSTYLSVNRAGAALWPALQAGATRQELVTRLVERFGLDEASAGRDVDAFVAALDGQDLLARSD